MARNRRNIRGPRQSQRQSCTDMAQSNNFMVIRPEEIQVSFDEIIGHQECKKDLNTLLSYLKDPEQYKQYGVTPYCKYLISGPNGVGKSTLALSIAKSANLPVVCVEPSFFLNTETLLDEVDSLFLKVDSLLEEHSNCVLLLKEVQYIGALDSEIEQALIEKLLGYFREAPWLVAFATFEPCEEAILHNLLVGKHAFSKIVELLPPELKVREQIINNLLQTFPVEDGLNVHRLALDTYQMTTGNIKKLLTDALLLALQNGRTAISYSDFSEALAQEEFGYANSRLINDEERLATARHEAGHVIAGYFADPKNYKVSKVEITPRSYYLGATYNETDLEKTTQYASNVKHHIISLYGGMASEHHYYQETSTGVSSDLAHATALAINYHKAYGMCQAIGPVCLSSEDFKLSGIEKNADFEIQNFLKSLYKQTQEIIRKHSAALDELTQALMDNEVLYSEGIMAILEKYNK